MGWVPSRSLITKCSCWACPTAAFDADAQSTIRTFHELGSETCCRPLQSSGCWMSTCFYVLPGSVLPASFMDSSPSEHGRHHHCHQLPVCCVQEAAHSLLVCSFSPDSTYIAAGSNDSCVYVWHWEALGSAQQSSTLGPVKQRFYGKETLESMSREEAAAVRLKPQQWAQPQEVCRLTGHAGPVMMLQFSHDGAGLATGSKDGSLQVSSHHDFSIGF